MKYLEIKNNKGYYFNDTEMVEIDQINKEDLLKLIIHAEENEFDMDTYDENQLQNKSHQIIYQGLYQKLKDFLDNNEQFDSEVDDLYAKAIGEYGADIQAEADFEEAPVIDEENNLQDIPF